MRIGQGIAHSRRLKLAIDGGSQDKIPAVNPRLAQHLEGNPRDRTTILLLSSGTYLFMPMQP